MYEQLSLFQTPEPVKLPPEELPRHCGKRPRILIQQGRGLFGYSYSVQCPVCGYSTSPYATMACAVSTWKMMIKEKEA